MRSINKQVVGIFSFTTFLRPFFKLFIPYFSDVDGIVKDRFDTADIKWFIFF